jgi:type IX secretion system PorP/SprF family membrane protein
MKTKILRICFFVSMMSTAAYGQQNFFYNHYYINPFLYNPSYIAPSGYTEVYVNYRKQWSGIEGAPTTGTFNLHVPLNYKAGVAFTAALDEAGLLKTTTGMVSFSYQIYLGKKITDIHKISFGLSAGVTNSRINADEADDAQDPVVGNSTSSIDGKFGVHYQYNGFKLGFALPTIFETKVASQESFNKAGIAQLNSTITSMSYEFKFGPRVSLEPMVSYRTFETLDPQLEGLASVKLSNVGWIGGGYRQDYGAFGFLGVNIKDKYKVGYAYEFATEQTDKIGFGTHEVQVIVRVGRRQFARPQAVHKTPTHTVAQEAAPAEEKPDSKNIDPVEEPKDQVSEPVNEPVTEAPKEVTSVSPPVNDQPKEVVEAPKTIDPVPTAVEEPKKNQFKTLDGGNLRPGHYVVVGAFANAQNAKNYQNTLKKSGYPAHVSFHPEKGYFIVHMDNVETLEEARTLRDKYRQMSRYSFRDTWILSVE